MVTFTDDDKPIGEIRISDASGTIAPRLCDLVNTGSDGWSALLWYGMGEHYVTWSGRDRAPVNADQGSRALKALFRSKGESGAFTALAEHRAKLYPDRSK